MLDLMIRFWRWVNKTETPPEELVAQEVFSEWDWRERWDVQANIGGEWLPVERIGERVLSVQTVYCRTENGLERFYINRDDILRCWSKLAEAE